MSVCVLGFKQNKKATFMWPYYVTTYIVLINFLSSLVLDTKKFAYRYTKRFGNLIISAHTGTVLIIPKCPYSFLRNPSCLSKTIT